MKIIENKETTLGNDIEKVTYVHLIKSCVNSVDPQKGVVISDMRHAIRILDAIESKKIEVEENDFAFLKTKVNEMKWAIIHKDVLEFNDYINNL